MTLGESKGPMSQSSMEEQVSLRDLSEMLEMPLWDMRSEVFVCVRVCVCVFREMGRRGRK